MDETRCDLECAARRVKWPWKCFRGTSPGVVRQVRVCLFFVVENRTVHTHVRLARHARELLGSES